jgi:hypothetical protein
MFVATFWGLFEGSFHTFPIPFISKENIQKIDSLVHAILFSKHKNDLENIRKNCNKIDEIIFKLYSLSDEERKIILLDN